MCAAGAVGLVIVVTGIARERRRRPIEPPGSPATGLVFQSGTKVGPGAYVSLLREVSRSDVPVVIVKQPYDIGFLVIDQPSRIIAASRSRLPPSTTFTGFPAASTPTSATTVDSPHGVPAVSRAGAQ